MAVCANCEHPVKFHGGPGGCLARYQLDDPSCGCRWHEGISRALRPSPVTLAAVAHPGDTVILTFSHMLSDEEVEQLFDHWKPLAEQGIKVAFADQVSGVVVCRGGNSDETHEPTPEEPSEPPEYRPSHDRGAA